MEASNAKEMREALRQVSRVAVEMTRKTVTGESEDRNTIDEWAHRLCDIVSAALAAHPRNCDVGTAEEQYARVRAFCKRHKVGLRCVDCHVNGLFPKNCALIWSQMPYEEGGANGK